MGQHSMHIRPVAACILLRRATVALRSLAASCPGWWAAPSWQCTVAWVLALCMTSLASWYAFGCRCSAWPLLLCGGCQSSIQASCTLMEGNCMAESCIWCQSILTTVAAAGPPGCPATYLDQLVMCRTSCAPCHTTHGTRALYSAITERTSGERRMDAVWLLHTACCAA